MASIIENLFGNGTNKPTNETLAYSLMAGTAAAAAAYLTATLDATTPEVRRMLNDYMNQIVMEHESLAMVSVTKGWYMPYEAPLKQLESTINHSANMLGDKSSR